MSPEAEDYLAMARDDLAEAAGIAGIGLHRAAARSACYAAFHAAEAFIHARTGRVAKTHAGVRSLFALLARRETDIAHDLPGVLARAYEFKEHADYRTAKMADVSAAQAETQITAARRFVGEVTRVLMAP